MTPEELKHAAEVMTAAANGATIEQAFYYDTGQGPWCVEDDPAWDWDAYLYRVKHEPITIDAVLKLGSLDVPHFTQLLIVNPDEVRRRLVRGQSVNLKFREVADGS